MSERPEGGLPRRTALPSASWRANHHAPAAMDEYAYVNARIRAMQGRLLSRAHYDALISRDAVESVLEGLKDSPYAPEIARSAEAPVAGTRLDPAARFDEALRRDLAGTVSKLRHLASDRLLELMDAILIRWDAYNVKTVLRGKRAAAPLDEILAATIPAGALDEAALAELSRAPTVQAVVDTLASWQMPLARPAREGLQALGGQDSLQPLELALDRFACAHALGAVANGDHNDAAVRTYLRLVADRTNLLTALRHLEDRNALTPVEAARDFLDAGGRFTRTHYQAVATARDLRHGLSLLAGTPFDWLSAAATDPKPISIPAIERQLDRVLIRETVALSRRDPLGIGVLLAYLERKINEVRNLRMIVRGRSLNLGPEQIDAWLIIWPGSRHEAGGE